MILKVFISGISILVIAILANLVASYLGITTWYVFLNEINELGLFNTIKKQGILSIIFLFIIYPLVLGIAGYFTFHFLRQAW